MPDEALIILSGEPKISMKSWFAFMCSMILATGKAWGGLKPTGVHPVIIYEAEAPPRPTRNRFEMLQNGTGMQLTSTTPLYFAHMAGLYLDNAQSISDCIEAVRATKTKLVIVDTFAKSSRAMENDASQVSLALRNTDLIRKAGASVMLIHHTKKINPEFGHLDIDQSLRGSSALAGAYDLHINMRKQDINAKHIDCTMRSKDAEEQNFSLQWRFDKEANAADLLMERVGGEAVPQHMLDKVRRDLLPQKPYNAVKIKALAGNVSMETAERIIALLVADRTLMEDAKGYYYLTV